MMIDRGPRQSKLMKIFDLQNDFIKHRQKIINTQRKDAAVHLKKSYNSQMDRINSFRKNWANSTNFKTIERQKEINHSNKLLQQSILKQYYRQSELVKSKKNMSNTVKSNSSSRLSLASSSSKRQAKAINEENTRLMKKIMSIQSHLAKDKMDTLYEKTKVNKQRLEVFSSKNKERLRRSLNKMHIQPTVYFPKMKQKQHQTIK